jgi:hypothetical protein
MGDTSPELNPDLVYDLFWGIFKPQFIRLALQLDAFTPLAAGSTTAEQVAQSCHCDTFGMKSLLDYLCSLQVLECHFFGQGSKSVRWRHDIALHRQGAIR